MRLMAYVSDVSDATAPVLRRRAAQAVTRIADVGGPLRAGQVLRATLAGLVAWYLCVWGGVSSEPYPAALAALLCVRSTVVGSFSSAARYATGCLVGAAIALPVAYTTGPTYPGLAFVLLLSGLAGSSRLFGAHGMHVPATALAVLVLARGELKAELAPHIADIVLGAVVGVLFNLVHAPVRLRAAESAVDRARSELAVVLRGLGTALAEGSPPEQRLGEAWREPLSARVREARGELDHARESVRWNPRRRARRAVRRRLDEEALGALERLTDHAAEIGRVIDRATAGSDRSGSDRSGLQRSGLQRSGSQWARFPDEEFRHGYAGLLHGTAACVRECRQGFRHPVLGSTRAGWERLVRETDSRHHEHGPGTEAGRAVLAVEGRLLLLLDRALADLDRPEATSAAPGTSA
jgi:uncharacterized membrane protein YgaE (UPF0421/DUF939 family)